jgi:hypothetical protein
MTTDEWLILLMGMALACGPIALVWMENATRAKGGSVSSLVTWRGYSLSPHSGFSIVIGVMLIYLSYRLRASGLGFVFMVFGFIGIIVAIQNIRRTKPR